VKTLGFILFILIVLVVGGALTTTLTSEGGSIVPTIPQTDNPDGNVSEFEGWKAEQFFLLVGFILFNMIGIGATLALIFWLLDRGVRRARAASAVAESGEAAGSGGRNIQEA
jgi:hypothetical protein